MSLWLRRMAHVMEVVIAAILLLNVAAGDEPCDTTREVPDINNRFPYVKEDHGDDRFLTERWYRLDNTMAMARSFPAGQRGCGARQQCWMNEDMPGETEGERNVEICVSDQYDNTNNCMATFSIKVKNCGNHNVYLLKPTDPPEARYCFEVVADRGQAGDIAPTFQTSNVQIQTEMMLNNTNYDYEIKFLCQFKEGSNFHYTVSFFVNGKLITSKIKTVQNATDAFILESDLSALNSDYVMGITIACSVGAKNAAFGKVGPVVRSTAFYAGLKIEEDPRGISLPRGGTRTIRFRPTVPVGCRRKLKRNCTLVARLANVTGYGCNSNAINYHKCAIPIQGGYTENFFREREWNKTYSVVIETGEDEDVSYNLKTSQFTLLLEVIPGEHHTFWKGLSQIVTVNVYDEDDAKIWKNGKCHIYGDPHVTTFDGMKYELQKGGDYLAFKHATLPLQVQVKSISCNQNGRSPYCICGTAVVAGKTVFMLSTCSKVPEVNFLNCGGGDELRVVHYFTKFEFFFPTGLQLRVTRAPGIFWNLAFSPTVHEVKKTSGLCGSLDGDRCNDCFLKDTNRNDSTCNNSPPDTDCVGNLQYHPNDFTASYSLQMNESLFGSNTPKIIEGLEDYSRSGQLCHCPYDNRGIPTADNKAYPNVTCSYRKYHTCGERNRVFSCHIHTNFTTRRRKRSTQPIPHLETMSSVGESLFARSIEKRSTMSESTARSICESTMRGSPTLNDCRTMGLNMSDAEIENCVSDLVASGNIVWATDAMGRASQSCLQEVTKNSTARETYPESANLVQNLTCLNNCSNNGICSNGECTCTAGFAGADCSVNLSVPPKVNDLDLGDDLICDKKYSCNEVSMIGGDFPSDASYTCHFSVFQVNVDRNDSRIFAGEFDATGMQMNIFQVSCPLTVSKTSEMTVALEYTVRLRMNENEFSPGLHFVVMDSVCQEYRVTNGKYTYYIMTGNCFIEGECVSAGTRKVGDCQQCLPDINVYTWSPVSDTPGCVVEDDDQAVTPTDTSITLQVGILVTCGVLIVAAITVGTIVFLHRRNLVRCDVAPVRNIPVNEDPLLVNEPHDIPLQNMNGGN